MPHCDVNSLNIDSFSSLIYPAVVDMHIGGTVVFNCWADGAVIWTFKGSRTIPSNSRYLVDGSKLVVENVSPANSGEYACQGQFNFKSFVETSDLKVYGNNSVSLNLFKQPS